MHSEGILSAELKHGPLAMIDKDMPCIMIITRDNTYTVRSSSSQKHFLTFSTFFSEMPDSLIASHCKRSELGV